MLKYCFYFESGSTLFCIFKSYAKIKRILQIKDTICVYIFCFNFAYKLESENMSVNNKLNGIYISK